ncbi:MAG: DNA replication/repair protein RecF [Oscillospiraceae bacterium]|nr:DNA replication/repair protein RecF [Oscillospiraceae bacterium]
MYLKTAQIKNFRNIKSAELSFSPNVNVILGKNAQGKTNLLEAIWLLSGNKSFRGATDKEICAFEENSYYIGAKFCDSDEEIRLSIGCDTGSDKPIKKVLRGEKKYSTQRALLGAVPMTVFSPDDLELIKAGPINRRNYCDSLLCMLFPAYAKSLSRYNRIVSQKNALLRDEAETSVIEIWNEQLALFGASIIKSRIELLKRLLNPAQSCFYDMAGQTESLDIEYKCTVCENADIDEAELCNIFKKKLSENAYKEQSAGACLYGPHRDDLEVKINEKSARQFASQGQQRSAVLALLLAKTQLLKNHTGKTPIVLLDDVMSELDEGRQRYLLEKIEDFQVLITCCQEEILGGRQNKTFCVSDGKICEKED